jgi:hypothetical protein
MDDQVAHRLNILKVYLDTFRLIRDDPETSKTTRTILDDMFAAGVGIFPTLVVGAPQEMVRQAALLRQGAEICNGIIWEISRDLAAPHSTRVYIQHAMFRLGTMIRRYQKEHSPYEYARHEVCAEAKAIPPPRRPALQVYRRDDPTPRDILVFRR